ncbi:enoyl-CoA hydratase-related protein [Nocardioides sp. BP30]|uniref:enoyl-CoA hydratase/isomerase family protein n=1 Tax=Nocardioides sp. BP30 TaxID=3036374 RepID=UPI002469ACFE|nr:enoyl-CoA hydratase-related protein [Nocardioides sp. BP30]WGL54041.1 enoyl-CoA hydratase-related protein [Nocardioides sp. BP30]
MSYVTYEHEAGLVRITLADAEHGNAIHLESVHELFGAVRRARQDHARVILLSAVGRFFSVGGDLGSFAGADDMALYLDDVADSLHRVVSELIRADAVVVCAVQGPAAGAGFPLAAAADIVVAAESASFRLGYGKVGLSVDGGTSLLVNTLGLHTTLRLALLGDSLSAQEALAAGLVARVVPDHQLRGATEEVVATLLALSAGAQAVTKHLIRDRAEAAPEAALRQEALGIRSLGATAEAREGVSAFLEKRRPAFGQR